MMYRRGWRTIAVDLGVDELIAHGCWFIIDFQWAALRTSDRKAKREMGQCSPKAEVRGSNPPGPTTKQNQTLSWYFSSISDSN
jgi:hypothetical protein